jgi:hypothetical protein
MLASYRPTCAVGCCMGINSRVDLRFPDHGHNLLPCTRELYIIPSEPLIIIVLPFEIARTLPEIAPLLAVGFGILHAIKEY